MRSVLVLSILLLASSASVASGCQMTTTTPDVDTGPLPGGIRYYVDRDPACQPDCNSLIPWIYEESNGIEGLQRQDEIIDDTCRGAAGPGDTIIF